MDFDALTQFELKGGNHARAEDGLCVMEAVAWFAGEWHSDHPACVCPVIAHFCRAFNDRLGQRRQELVPYIPRLMNTQAAKPVTLARLEILLADYVDLGGNPERAASLARRFQRARLAHYGGSFGLGLICEAISLKRSADHCYVLLDRLLGSGRPTAEAPATVCTETA